MGIKLKGQFRFPQTTLDERRKKVSEKRCQKKGVKKKGVRKKVSNLD